MFGMGTLKQTCSTWPVLQPPLAPPSCVTQSLPCLVDPIPSHLSGYSPHLRPFITHLFGTYLAAGCFLNTSSSKSESIQHTQPI